MRIINLTINDKNGIRTVEYAFADEGKVFVDKDENTFSNVELERINEFIEVEASLYEELLPEEAIEILLGGTGE